MEENGAAAAGKDEKAGTTQKIGDGSADPATGPKQCSEESPEGNSPSRTSNLFGMALKGIQANLQAEKHKKPTVHSSESMHEQGQKISYPIDPIAPNGTPEQPNSTEQHNNKPTNTTPKPDTKGPNTEKD
eukprot:3123023-Rhodomonas_salina.2